MENYDKVNEIVKDYLAKNGMYYIPNFNQLSSDEYNHILNIGTDIMLNYWGMNEYESGSFIKNFINNDLQGTFASADSINQNCIRFYIMLKNNASFVSL